MIFGVVATFNLVEDRQIAATEAGTLFVLLPPLLAWKEYKIARLRRRSFYVGLLQFWLFFALPILGLRIFNWDEPFSNLSILGIPGPALHQFANWSYLLMMALTAWNYVFKESSAVKAAEAEA